MSFCTDTKNHLCALKLPKGCCRTALFHGLVIGARRYSDDGFYFATECEAVAELLYKLAKELCKKAPLKSSAQQAGRTVYTVEYKKGEGLEDLRELFYVFTDPYRPDDGVIYECDKCSSYFLRGLFLSVGQLSEPSKSLRLELPLRSASTAKGLDTLLSMASLEPCKTQRRGKPLLYYRKSELIEHFLGYIGAGNSVLAIIEEKIVKELRNDMNRQNNLENASLRRAVDAAVEQISIIKELDSRGLLETLPEDLKATASLRLLYSDATLEKLGAKHIPPISKSGVKHRLEKIKELWEKYKK